MGNVERCRLSREISGTSAPCRPTFLAVPVSFSKMCPVAYVLGVPLLLGPLAWCVHVPTPCSFTPRCPLLHSVVMPVFLSVCLTLKAGNRSCPSLHPSTRQNSSDGARGGGLEFDQLRSENKNMLFLKQRRFVHIPASWCCVVFCFVLFSLRKRLSYRNELRGFPGVACTLCAITWSLLDAGALGHVRWGHPGRGCTCLQHGPFGCRYSPLLMPSQSPCS